MQEQQIINQMIALSGKKRDMLIKIKELSEKQYSAFRDNALDGMEKILNRKDEIIQYIRRLDDAFLAAYENLKEILGIQSLDDLAKTTLDGRKELKGLIGEITALVESIIQLEKDGYENATVLKKDLGNKIKGVSAGKKMATAYTIKPNAAPSYFFDSKK